MPAILLSQPLTLCYHVLVAGKQANSHIKKVTIPAHVFEAQKLNPNGLRLTLTVRQT